MLLDHQNSDSEDLMIWLVYMGPIHKDHGVTVHNCKPVSQSKTISCTLALRGYSDLSRSHRQEAGRQRTRSYSVGDN
jgi:hypothetical protein